MIDGHDRPTLVARLALRAALGLSLLGAACGGGGGAAGVNVDMLPAAFAGAYCDKIYGCCSEQQRMGNLFVGNDVGECKNILGTFLFLALPSIKASVSSGRSVYHADRMGACLEKLRAASCESLRTASVGFSGNDDCEAAFEPKVAVGGSCGDSADCIGGWCEGARNGTLGKCVATKADGQPCVVSDECTSGSCSGGSCGMPAAGASNLCE